MQKIKLQKAGYYRAGRYDYYAIDREGETLISGIQTKKLANQFLGCINEAVSRTMEINEIDTVLDIIAELTRVSRNLTEEEQKLVDWAVRVHETDEDNQVYIRERY